jgi:hypothetical protein
MSDQPQGPGWWQASDGKYYPPESATPPPGYGQPTYGQPTYGQPAYGAPAYQQGPYGYGPTPAKQGTNGLAIASLVCGLLGPCTCVTSIAAIIMGHIAMGQIKDSNGTQEGRGFAIAGLALGYGILVLTIIYFVAIFSLGDTTSSNNF